MSRMNRLRVLSLAGTAALISACGSGGDGDMLGAAVAAAPSGVRRQTADRPSRARRHSLSKELTGACRAPTGPIDVWVTIDAPSMAAQQAKLASTAGVEKASKLSAGVEQDGSCGVAGEISQRARRTAIQGRAQSRQRRRRGAGARARRAQRDRRARRCVAARADRIDSGRRQGAAGPQLRNDAVGNRALRRRHRRASRPARTAPA